MKKSLDQDAYKPSNDQARSSIEPPSSTHPITIQAHRSDPDWLGSSHPPQYPYRLPSNSSSDSLPSSINTIIHLAASTHPQPSPIPKPPTAHHASSLESQPDPPQPSPDLTSHPPPATSLELDDPSDPRTSRIQFHQVVRISGGINSNPRRKKARHKPHQAPRNIPIEQPPRTSLDQQLSNTTSPSPLRNSFVPNLSSGSILPSDHASTSLRSSSAVRSSRQRQLSRFSDRESSSSPIPRSLSTHRHNPLRPGPPSARSSFSHRSSNEPMPRSLPNQPDGFPAPHTLGLTRSYTRTTSMSSSFTGSGPLSTVISRSSSPASSLYLPLRVPLVRAPAPFFGPTPERVARVRERRQVARRDAERAQGGWKAWWNDWYYHSDKLTSQKGKARQHSTTPHDHHQPGDPSHSVGCCDSDDGSCYHDVILEHERKKLERKLLRKLQQSTTTTTQLDRSASKPQSRRRKRSRAHAEKAPSTSSPSWFSWAFNLISRIPPPPVHPLRLPTPPGAGILRPSEPIIPQSNEQIGVSPIYSPDPGHLITVEEVNSRTPLLLQASQTVPNYGELPSSPRSPSSSPLPPRSSLPSGHTPTLADSVEVPKATTDKRFGVGPQSWRHVWWLIGKVKSILRLGYLKLKARLADLFHIDWDPERRYEGWENV